MTKIALNLKNNQNTPQNISKMTRIHLNLKDEQTTPEASKITKIEVWGILDVLRVFLSN